MKNSGKISMQRVAFLLHKQWFKCACNELLGELKIDDNLNFITETEIIQILAVGPPKNLFLLFLISQEKFLKVS